jgi:phosphopentomutase
MEMKDKKMYVFNTQTGYNADVVIIFATSFDEAVLIYSRERLKDYATQSIHFYGVFDDEPDDQKSVKEKFDKYKNRWEICKKEPMDTDEYGKYNTIRSRTYSGKPYGDYDFRITVTELPIEEFQVICNTVEGEVFDKVAIMKIAKMDLDNIYHTDSVNEEAKRMESSIYDEMQTIKELIDTRTKYKQEMFTHPSDSEEYKAAKKKVDDLKKEINRLFSENDDMMINFKEKGDE